MPGKVALVFGASGVTGWSFVNEILHDYPKEGVWDMVHALTNRPLTQKDSMWPQDERLNIISGIDLLKGSQEDLEKELRSKVEGIEEITHVYYLGKNTKNSGIGCQSIVLIGASSFQSLQGLSPRIGGRC